MAHPGDVIDAGVTDVDLARATLFTTLDFMVLDEHTRKNLTFLVEDVDPAAKVRGYALRLNVCTSVLLGVISLLWMKACDSTYLRVFGLALPILVCCS
jgi:hypothetical protein